MDTAKSSNILHLQRDPHYISPGNPKPKSPRCPLWFFPSTVVCIDSSAAVHLSSAA